MVQQTLEQLAKDHVSRIEQSPLSPTDKALSILSSYRGYIGVAKALGYVQLSYQLAEKAKPWISAATAASQEISDLLRFYESMKAEALPAEPAKARRGRRGLAAAGTAAGVVQQADGVVTYGDAHQKLGVSNVTFGMLTRSGVLQVVGKKQISADSLNKFVGYMASKGYVAALQRRLEETEGASMPAMRTFVSTHQAGLISLGLIEKAMGSHVFVYPLSKEEGLKRVLLSRQLNDAGSGASAAGLEGMVSADATELSGGSGVAVAEPAVGEADGLVSLYQLAEELNVPQKSIASAILALNLGSSVSHRPVDGVDLPFITHEGTKAVRLHLKSQLLPS